MESVRQLPAKRKQMESSVLGESTPKRRRLSPPEADRIMVQALGFEKIYNDSIPLKELGSLIERHKYSYFRGLQFPSELIKERSVRAVGKLSYEQALKALAENTTKMPGN